MTIENEYKIIIEKNKGITHALKKLIEEMPNSIISGEEITLSEWDATMDKLVELNEKRKSEGKESIFTGGTDKTRNGWHNSFVVHPEQEITFSEEEMNEIFAAMGITISDTQAQQDPAKVNPPQEKADSAKVAPSNVESPKKIANSTNVAPPVDKSKSEKAKENTRLSWSEIGKIAWKSTKKFVKGMFCDEEGKFSLGRTAATVGIIAGLALAAPAVAALGASAAVVGAVATTVKVAGVALTGYMLYNGGKNVIEGTKDYYNAETKKNAVEAMEQAWDGGVELASIPVIGGLMKTGGKLLKFVKPKSSTPKSSTGGNEGGNQVSNTQPKPVETASTEAKPVEAVNEGGTVQPKPVENSTSNQSSSTQNSSSSQSSVVESQPITPEKERGVIEQMQRDAEAERIENKCRAERARKDAEARKAEEARKAQEAEKSRKAEETKLSEDERLAEARARQVEVTEETLPQLQEALRTELKEDVLVQQVLDEISRYLSCKDSQINADSRISFSEFPNNKVGIEVGGKTYLITKGSNPNIKIPELNPKSEPKVETKSKTETTQQTAVQSNNVTSFTTDTRSNISFDGRIFKIEKISSDEAVIILTEDVQIGEELLTILNAFTLKGDGIMDFTKSPAPLSTQLIQTKPGKLKLVNGQWKLIERIQVTDI